MRRLPVYFLIDVSESMVGEPVRQVEEGLATIIQALKSDPYAIETVWISIVVFAGEAKTLVPLQEIINFYPPRFPIGGGTSLSNGLGHLMYELRDNIVTTTYQQKGDWKPIVFLFTDGVPTDDAQAVIAEWKAQWQQKTNLIAVSFGTDTDAHLLRQLTENVLLFQDANEAAYRQFFKWVTDSIKTSSQSVATSGSGFEMAPMKEDVVSKIDLSKPAPRSQVVDSNFAVLIAKCQHNSRPYLIKYRKDIRGSEFAELGLDTRAYRLVGAFPVEQTYFELSDSGAAPFRINSEELIGAPTCPCCGDQIGFAMCACGGIHCLDEEGVGTCPWCGKEGRYGFGEGGFDVNRTQG